MELERDAQSGRLYVVWDEDVMGEAEIGVKMLMNNQIRGIVPISSQYVDDVLRLYYEIGRMQTLDECYRTNRLSVRMAGTLLLSIIKVVQAGEPYFMAGENFLLSEQYIYLSRDGCQPWICYIPGRQHDVYDGLKCVTEFLLQHLEHGVRSETAFFYGIYDMISERRHTLEQLAECLERQSVVRQRERRLSEAENLHDSVGEAATHKQYCFRLQKGQKIGSDLSHMLIPREIPLQGRRLCIGRKQGQDICLPAGQISREHAVLYCGEDTWQIEDKDSLNGTYVNGRKISAHVKVRCHRGDVITFADITYEIVEGQCPPCPITSARRHA